jgi:hypothetical protein
LCADATRRKKKRWPCPDTNRIKTETLIEKLKFYVKLNSYPTRMRDVSCDYLEEQQKRGLMQGVRANWMIEYVRKAGFAKQMRKEDNTKRQKKRKGKD